MEKEFELNICRAFFDKRCRERLYYELSAAKKRRCFFDRISHTADDYLSDCVTKRFSKPPCTDDISSFLRSKECYVIALNSVYDGKFADILQALEELWCCGEPFMTVNKDCTAAYLETEYDFSVHTAFFLEV
ncbi:MAG: hypothetical protein J6A37_09925 [Oscillospiraceae bacterium]|nr:hypothetical protein [Oscillospiraceae bacterium]